MKVCISKNAPSSIASGISSARFSRISSAMRALLTITSTAAIRPPPTRGSSRWLITPRRTPARIERTCWLLFGREELDHPADRLGRVERVQRREDEVARLGRLQRRLRRLGVAELADQDHVRVLPQRAPQRLAERLGVEPDLALVDDAAAVVVEELDRILDRDDVLPPRAVDVVDDRRERGRLARAGRAGDEHEAALLLGEHGDARRQAELVEVRDRAGIARNANEIAPRWRKPLTRKRGSSAGG